MSKGMSRLFGRAEETTIKFDEYHRVAAVRTTCPALAERLEALHKEYPEAVKRFVFKQKTDSDVDPFIDVVEYGVPKEFITIRKPAKYAHRETPFFSEYVRAREQAVAESEKQYKEEMQKRERKYNDTLLECLIENEMKKLRAEATQRIIAQYPDLFARSSAATRRG